jgi:hypothetical protein
VQRRNDETYLGTQLYNCGSVISLDGNYAMVYTNPQQFTSSSVNLVVLRDGRIVKQAPTVKHAVKHAWRLNLTTSSSHYCKFLTNLCCTLKHDCQIYIIIHYVCVVNSIKVIYFQDKLQPRFLVHNHFCKYFDIHSCIPQVQRADVLSKCSMEPI